MSKATLIKHAAQDLFELLERNFHEKKPLLEGAKMYRGTSTPVQAGGVLSDDTMHATLLPKVATMYTHNQSSGKAAYIGEYALDRTVTTFHKDYGLEDALKGKASGLSVEKAEELLRPKVAAMVNAPDERTKRNLQYDLEKFISKELHEAPLSAKAAHNPDALYYYTGRGEAPSNKGALMDMTKVEEHNNRIAKEAVLTDYRGPVANKIHMMQSTETDMFSKASYAEARVASDALRKLSGISQSAFVKEVRESYGHLPLQDMVKAVANHAGGEVHKQVDRLAGALTSMWKSDNPMHREAGHAAAALIAKLPEGSSLKDAVQALTAGTSLIKGKHSAHVESHGHHSQDAQVRLRDVSKDDGLKHDSVPKELVANRSNSAPAPGRPGLER